MRWVRFLYLSICPGIQPQILALHKNPVGAGAYRPDQTLARLSSWRLGRQAGVHADRPGSDGVSLLW